MIAIDTNVLLRYLLADDALQHKKAKNLIEKNKVLVTDVVLAETIWTLTGKRYSLSKEQVCEVLHSLMSDNGIYFESNQVIWSALQDFENSVKIQGKALDFADSLIANKAHSVANANNDSLEGFYSYDKAVSQLRGAKKP
ncbi:MAG: putative nucleic-acid-binding protein [Oleiphilaceae bacterium]|jgi:predicted nucleic-acid-binding protein